MKPALADIDSIVGCIRIVPRVIPDQTIFETDPLSPALIYRLAVYPQDLRMSNNLTAVYSAMDLSADSLFKISSGASPSTVELKAPYGAGGITREIIEMEYLRGSTCYFFNTCWSNPIEDEQPLGFFIWGKTVLGDNSYTVELTHFSDLLKQNINLKYTRLCGNFFADSRIDGTPHTKIVGYCGLNADDYTINGTITSIEGDQIFTDSSLSQVADYFGAGLVTFRNDVAMHGVDQNVYEVEFFNLGQFILSEIPRCRDLITVGTTFTAIAGCRKRRNIDCVGKYNNGLRFWGFHDIPMPSQTYSMGNI